MNEIVNVRVVFVSLNSKYISFVRKYMSICIFMSMIYLNIV